MGWRGPGMSRLHEIFLYLYLQKEVFMSDDPVRKLWKRGVMLMTEGYT